MQTLKEHRAFGGTLGFYQHESKTIDLPMRLSVFVPPGEGPHPVLYWLSGLTCTEENFMAKAGAQRVAAELGLMLVAPDTSPRGAGIAGEEDDWDFGSGAGFYVDATAEPWSRHYRMYSYVRDELPALIEANFPAQPDLCAISGHSMGGHGALVLGLKNPERYRSISAFAPICAPTRCPWGEKAFSGYLGDDRAAWAAYDASELVTVQRHPAEILIDQGEADGFLAEQLLPEHFEAAAAKAGQALRLRRHPGYDHSYYFIASLIEDHLRHHARLLAT